MLDAEFDADAIRKSTRIRHVEIHESIPSTNDRAAELARTAADLQPPALIVARMQTAGRGRGANTWWSSEGSLTFSLLLDAGSLSIGSERWPQLSLATAVAVCDALTAELGGDHSLSQSPGIKWPNDVLVDGRKICGILIESPAASVNGSRWLVIGIGLNVNNSWRQAPGDLAARGTALCDISTRLHSQQGVLIRIIQALEQRLGQLALGDLQLPAAWRRLSVLDGKEVLSNGLGRQIQGRCVGIDADGGLIVQTATGREILYGGSILTAAGHNPSDAAG
jgi:BirA family transcriptional regulator, biotin operon repressor / biotin---[acetyl-CoA-carboxylase] ligase